MTRATRVGLILMAGATAAATRTIDAQATFFTNLSAFNGASSTVLEATFEGAGEITTTNPFVQGRVTSTSTGAFAPFIAAPGSATQANFAAGAIPLLSNVLTASGNESFTFTFSGAAPTAVGFDVYTNQSASPTFTVFNTGGVNIGTFSALAANTRAFLGVTSTVGIGRIEYLAVNGENVNTGIDNVRVGTAIVASAVPEPSTYALVAAGLVAVGMLRRNRRK